MGQVILSQETGANWLMVDVTGTLMTDLMGNGRNSRPLYSDSIITDDVWYRVGITWDGTIKSLYVDDALVAEEADVTLASCGGGMNIGCSGSMAPGTFFSGLIDDVRIYNRAVRP